MSAPGEDPSPGGAAPLPRGAIGRALDRLYDACAALAGVAMVLLLVAVLLSVVSRQLGFNVAGIDSYAGYAMAAAGFLALAHTLKKGEHIRVTLLVSAAHGATRRALDRLYDATAALGAVAMVLLLVMVLLSVVSRQVGFNIGGIDAYAGYMMAGAGFLAMAHTLKRGEHIRVTLLLAALEGRRKHTLEVWALFAATLLALLMAGYSCKLAWQSYAFHDISTSNDATPLWLPQLTMALGAVVLAIAFVDELVLEIRGERFVPVSGEATRNE